MILTLSGHIPWLLGCPPRLCFTSAGDPNEQMMQHVFKEKQPAQHRTVCAVLPRYFYLFAQDRRISLCAIGSTLTGWAGGAWLMVETNEIVGAFRNDDYPGTPYIGNRNLAGQTGLHLTMRPVATMRGFADKEFDRPEELLVEIKRLAGEWLPLNLLPDQK